MKWLTVMLFAVVLTALLGGCQTSEEQEQQTNQRRYDTIINKNQKMIDQNQKTLDRNR